MGVFSATLMAVKSDSVLAQTFSFLDLQPFENVLLYGKSLNNASVWRLSLAHE